MGLPGAAEPDGPAGSVAVPIATALLETSSGALDADPGGRDCDPLMSTAEEETAVRSETEAAPAAGLVVVS